MKIRPEVLLVDDNPADIDLMMDVLTRSKRSCHVEAVFDGDEALSFVRHLDKYAQAPSPDVVVLDLSLPRKDGREVLAAMKKDPALARIPVIVFTTSQATSDIVRSYELGASCYLHKPGNLRDFMAMVQSMADFWLGSVSLPDQERK